MLRKPKIIWPAGIFSCVLILTVASSASFFQIRKKCLEKFEVIFPAKESGEKIIRCHFGTTMFHKIIHPELTDSVFQNFPKLKFRLENFRYNEDIDEAIVIRLKKVSYKGVTDLISVCYRTHQYRFTISNGWFYIYPGDNRDKISIKSPMCFYKY